MPPRKRAQAVQELTPDALRKLLNKEYGAGTVMLASDPSLVIQRIPTGILSVDWHTSGGFARNRYAEIFGASSVGKSTLALRLIAMCQSLGGIASYIDCEKSFDPQFALNLGVNIGELDYHRQVSGNTVVGFMETLLRAGLHDVIVLDSVSALIPQYEIDNDMNAGSMGAEQAKMMSKALRKLTVANKKTVVVFINQTREMLNVTFGKKTTTSGGRALPHYAGVRIEIVRTEQIKKKGQVVIDHKTARDTKGDVVLGFRALLRVEKDKTGGSQPSTETTFVFDYETGNIDPVEDLIYVGRLAGLVKKSGQDASEKWWVVDYEDEVQKGRPRFKKWLARNTAVAEELEEKIRAQIGATATALDDDNEDEQE